MSHPELESEQAYVDHAYEQLERMRAVVAGAGDRVDGEVAQAAMDAWAAKRLRTFEDAEQGLCFGRLDFERDRSTALRRAPVSSPRGAPPAGGQLAGTGGTAVLHRDAARLQRGVTLRRRFRTHGRQLTDISDESLDGSIVDGAAVGDFLLEELERGRERHMRDIVATIQADQYRLITADPAPPLVIQGGPGTGKTAVGLHRASFLLYSFRDTLARRGVLVVGPNRLFMEYALHVLPALGESVVEQRAVGRARRRDRGNRARSAGGRRAQVGSPPGSK